MIQKPCAHQQSIEKSPADQQLAEEFQCVVFTLLGEQAGPRADGKIN
ncbi:MAG: hypothetical protein JEZ12_23060 [Desulfobacterium sp.]|nr:hypothetical protein [Desulfobacterium sp.]